MNEVKTVSIIGRGDFGSLLFSFVPEGIDCAMYGSNNTVENIETIAKSDIIILSVPLQAYELILKLLEPELRPETLFIDVCSVKVIPAKLIHEHLPRHNNVLLTHPLFGPQSIANGDKHTLVVTESKGDRASEVVRFSENELKLSVMHMTNEEHDKRMSEVHALTFFIARALSQLGLKAEPFKTPSFNSLLKLADLDSSQSEALFQTIESGNPFAKAERSKFLKTLAEINQHLDAL